jgi:hypothetical protein
MPIPRLLAEPDAKLVHIGLWPMSVEIRVPLSGHAGIVTCKKGTTFAPFLRFFAFCRFNAPTGQ